MCYISPSAHTREEGCLTHQSELKFLKTHAHFKAHNINHGSHITLQPKSGCPLKLSRVELVSTWMGDLMGQLGCCWKRC